MKKDEQANVLLSLKNLYRLFTVKDYPVYSTGILGEKSKKGLTLVRFWDEYLLYEWKSTRHGKMIFRKDGSQNRYHSEFCNRKESFPLYHIYIEEVLEGLNTETFGSQVLIFEKFNLPVDNLFWAYIIKQKFIEEAKCAPGGTIKTITKEVLSDFDIKLPSLAEQEAIGSFFSILDQHITLHQRKSI